MVLAPSAAKAQYLPLGGRTASMGGAAAAWGHDSAMPYLNPAGYALVPHPTLSLSASLYRTERVSVHDFFFHGRIDPTLGNLAGTPVANRNDLTSSTFAGFPGTVSLLWHFGPENDENAVHHVLGISATVPHQTTRSYAGDFALNFPGNRTLRDAVTTTVDATEYQFGPTYAVKLGQWRFGVTAALTYYTSVITQTGQTQFTRQDGFAVVSQSSYSDSKSLGFQPVLGVQWSPPSGMGLGASVALRSFPITSSTTAQSRLESSGPSQIAGANLMEVDRANGSTDRVFPFRLRGGVGYERKKKWAFALDGQVDLAQTASFDQRLDATHSVQEQNLPVAITQETLRSRSNERTAFAVRAGGEVFLGDLATLRGGLYYEQSSNILTPQSSDILLLDVDRAGLTFGFGLESDVGETTIGLDLSAGKGKTVASDAFASIGTVEFVRTDVSVYTGALFISGAVDLKEFGALFTLVKDPEAAFGGKKHFVRLRDLGPDFGSYEGDPDVDVVDSSGIYYLETGEADVDAFLARIARIRASVLVSRRVADELANEIRQLKTAAGATPDDVRAALASLLVQLQADFNNTSLPTLPVVKRAAKLLRTAVLARRAVEGMTHDVVELIPQAKRLMETESDRLNGPRAVLLPAILRGLGNAQSDLGTAIQDLPRLASSLAKLFEELASPPPAPQPNTAPPAPTSPEEKPAEGIVPPWSSPVPPTPDAPGAAPTP